MITFPLSRFFIKIQDFAKNSNFQKNFQKKLVFSHFVKNLIHILEIISKFLDQFEILLVSAISGDIEDSRRSAILKFYKIEILQRFVI